MEKDKKVLNKTIGLIILFYLCSLFFCACNQQEIIPIPGTDDSRIITDVNIINKYDSLLFEKQKIELLYKKDSINSKKSFDSLKIVKSNINNQLFLANQKINKVKVYIKIVKHNPNNKEFFYGWVIRAVDAEN